MTDSETRLRTELEAVHAGLRRLSPDMLLLEGVPTDARSFSKEETNLLVVRTRSEQMPFLVLVDDNLRYDGPDPFLASVFSRAERKDGWRPLLLAPKQVEADGLADVARSALRFLGFPSGGSSPALPSGLSAEWGFREAFPPLIGREAIV